MDADVVIAGAGTNGLMLACELGLAGVRTVVLEKQPGPGGEAKANGLLGQVVTMIDRRGLYEPLSGRPGPPEPSPFFMFAAMGLNLGILDESPVHTLPVPQPHLVRVLAERADELGADVRWGHALVGLEQDDDAVTAEVDGPSGTYRVSARHLVGVDGGHSLTRKSCGIDFPGVSYDRVTRRWGNATVPDAWLDPVTGGLDVPGHGLVRPFLGERTERGGFSFAPLPGQPPTIATMEWDEPGPDAPMSLDELRDSVRRVLGVDVPIGPPDGDGPHALRRLTGGSNRHAERFRDGRVFLLGDAAHVDAAGGQGLNLGMQDAINLGWKLAADVRGDAPAGLLDTYDAERRPAAARVDMYARATAALLAPGADVTALRELFGELLEDRSGVQRIADLIAGTDVRYDMKVEDPHPLVGRCAPEMELELSSVRWTGRPPGASVEDDRPEAEPTRAGRPLPLGPAEDVPAEDGRSVRDRPEMEPVPGSVRLAELTRTGRPLLIDLTADGLPVHGRVDVVRPEARPGTPSVLVRPDCYVAWASSSPRPTGSELDELDAAVRRWFGAPV